MNYLKNLGDLIEFEDYLVFFGTKKADIIDIETHLPQKTICLLKQTHGDVLREAQDHPPQEGDAHWSSHSKNLLLIQTADCLPIMICSPSSQKMLAIHAGWKGVALKIVEKSILALGLEKYKDLRIWIGPHIQRTSFEVQLDVAEKILAPYHIPTQQGQYVEKSGAKFYIDLAGLTQMRLTELGIPVKQISVSPINTRLSSEHNSYRRGDRGCRNYSFITKI